MRLVGFVLLLVGFLWLAWSEFSIGPILRVAVEMESQDLAADRDTLYTRGQVMNGTARAIGDFSRRLPNFMLPGCAMLVGGLLLTTGRRARP